MAFDGISAFGQPSLQRVAFDDPHVLLLAFGALVVAALLWLVLGSLHRSFALRRVECPVRAEAAFVVVRKRGRARAMVIQACSLAPRGLTCGTPCARQIARA